MTLKRNKKINKKLNNNSRKKGTQKKALKKYPKDIGGMITESNGIRKTNNNNINNNNNNNNNNNMELNRDVIKIFGELENIMSRKGEPMRARAYKNAQEAIMKYNKEIKGKTEEDTEDNLKELLKLKGVGETIVRKVKEYLTTGKIEALEKEKSNPINIFTDIYGVGPAHANKLIEKNIKTIAELREKLETEEDLLNDKQKIGLEYYEDILEKIPREEITKYDKKFWDIFKKLTKCDGEEEDSTYTIVGSYRRGAKTSGDIDIIITNKKDDKKIFNEFLDKLREEGIVLHFLSKGKTKSLTITKLSEKSRPRRVDFLYAPPDEYAFSQLYFTGSKAFNVVMRQRALDLGFTLNEHGISKMTKEGKGDKISQKFKDEQSIFDFLGLAYKKPEERKDGRAIIVTTEIEGHEKPEEILKLELKGTPKDKDKDKEKGSPKNKTLKIAKEHKTKKEDYSIRIANFKEKGIDYLDGLSEEQLNEIIKESNAAYYNNKTLMTDNEYDIIKEYIEKKYPKNKVIEEIGAPAERDKVTLPYEMPSMDKIKPDTKALDNWKSTYKGPYVLSCKLDGISALFTTEGTTTEGTAKGKLYTRGNGKVGQDISHLIPYLKLPTGTPNITIRGEIIMKKTTFIAKYSDKAANSRNLVAGIVNSKKSGTAEKYRDMDFVIYEVIKANSKELKPSQQFNYLKKITSRDAKTGITSLDVVQNEVLEGKDLTNEKLSEILISWRDSYLYEIDGVIVTNDEIYPRTGGNPKHSFAFKMVLSDQVVEAKVLDVIWSASKHGLMKPRIRIEPVTIGGAKIEYATAFNGNYVYENKIGIGAVVRLVRSGDVIPHILAVIMPAETAKMPNNVEWDWNETHVDIVLKDANQDETVTEKQIIAFFKGLDITGLGEGNVRKIMKAGFDTITKIIKMTETDYLKVDGFKQRMSEKVYNSINTTLKTAKISKIMGVSNMFGRGMGERRMQAILDEYPDIFVEIKANIKRRDKDNSNADNSNAGLEPGFRKELNDKIKNIQGFSDKTASLFTDNIHKFIRFMDDIDLGERLIAEKKKKTSTNKEKKADTEAEADTEHPLSGKKILLTGFRNKELEANIEKVDGKIQGNVSKTTDIVIVKSLDETTGKVDKARELIKEKGANIRIITLEDFRKEFGI